MNRAAIYARYSSDLQRDTSIEDQVAACKARAAELGWTVVEVYSDRAETATTMLHRHDLLRMLEDGERKTFDVLLVEGLDRLARCQADMHTIHDRLQFADIGIYTLSDNGFVDDLDVTFRGFQNARFSKDLGHKVKRGQRGAVKRGSICGSVAYGYDLFRSVEVPKGGREINESEAVIIRRIYADFAAGIPGQKIVESLNKDGVPAPDGGPWISSTLFGKNKSQSGILRNPLYKGLFVWNKETGRRNPVTGNRVTKATPASDRVLIEVPHLQIVDPATWEAVQQRLATSRLLDLPRRKRPKHLFSGLVVCGDCNRNYTVVDRTKLACSGRLGSRICTNRRRLDRADFEDFVLNTMSERLADPKLLASYVAEYRSEYERRSKTAPEEQFSLQTRIDALDRKLKILLATLSDPESSGPAYDHILQEMHKVAAELKDARAKLEPPAQIPSVTLDTNDIVQRLASQLSRLREALLGEGRQYVEARDTIRALISQIVITPLGEFDDKRGGGPVTVHIEGEWARLMAVVEGGACKDRMVLSASSSCLQQNHASSFWQFSAIYSNTRRSPALNHKRYIDAPHIYSALTQALKPMTAAEIAERVIAAGGEKVTEPLLHQISNRVRNALYYYQAQGLVKTVNLAGHRSKKAWIILEANSALWEASTPALDGGYVDAEKIITAISRSDVPPTAEEIAACILSDHGGFADRQRLRQTTVAVRNRLVYHQRKGRVRQVKLPGSRSKGWVIVRTPAPLIDSNVVDQGHSLMIDLDKQTPEWPSVAIQTRSEQTEDAHHN